MIQLERERKRKLFNSFIYLSYFPVPFQILCFGCRCSIAKIRRICPAYGLRSKVGANRVSRLPEYYNDWLFKNIHIYFPK